MSNQVQLQANVTPTNSEKSSRFPVPDARLLEKLKAHKLMPYYKKAEDSKATFEQNFFQLASDTLNRTFPRLNDYIIGFQLYDKSKDHSKATGFMGLRLRTIALIPFFFDEGNITGYEMMFLPKQNLFLPTTEPWISVMKNKTDGTLGKLTDLISEERSYPDLTPLRRPLIGAYTDIVKRSSSELLKTASNRLVPEFKLEHALKHRKVARALITSIDKYPQLLNWICKFHSPDLVKEALETAKQEPYVSKVAVPVRQQEQTQNLKIYDSLAPEYTNDLSPKEVDIIRQKGYLVKDARSKSDIAKVMTYVNDKIFFPIDETGFYTILDTNLNPKKVFVFVSVNQAEGTGIPQPDAVCNLPTHFIFEVDKTNRLKGTPRKWKGHSRKQLYAIKKHPDDPATFLNKFKKIRAEDLNNINAFITDANNKDYQYRRILLIDPSLKSLLVSARKYKGEPWRLEASFSEAKNTDGRHLKIYRRTSGERVLLVPEGTRIVVFPEDDNNIEAENILDPLVDPVSFMLKMEKAAHLLKIYRQDDEFIIDKQRFSKLGALAHLMRNYRLREDTALEILDETLHTKVARRWVKRAVDAPYLIHQKDFQPKPYFVEAPVTQFAPGYPATQQYATEYLIPGIKRPEKVLNIMEPPPQQVMVTLKRIADANDGEVFDFGLLTGLLNSTKDTTLIEVFLPSLIKALDTLGRILFNLYRHRSIMIDRYGRTDYMALVDSVRTNFENLGDLVIDLIQDKLDNFIFNLEPNAEVQQEEGEES